MLTMPWFSSGHVKTTTQSNGNLFRCLARRLACIPVSWKVQQLPSVAARLSGRSLHRVSRQDEYIGGETGDQIYPSSGPPYEVQPYSCSWCILWLGCTKCKVLSRDCMLSIDQLGPGLHELPGPLGLHDPSQLCRWRGVLHGSGFVVLNGMASQSHSFDFWLRWPVHEA